MGKFALYLFSTLMVALIGCGSDDTTESDSSATNDAIADVAVVPDETGGQLDVVETPDSTDIAALEEVTGEIVGEIAEEVTQEIIADLVEEVEFPLEEGDPVPDFEIKAHDGTTFKPSDYEGKMILISAFPAATTAVCTIQTCYVRDHYQEFLDLNTVAVGMSTDNLGKLAQWAIDEEFPQLLLSDTSPIGAISEMFGILGDMNGAKYTERANIIISVDRKVLWKKVYVMSQTPNFGEVMEVLEANQ